jgi:hypothetical protein
MGILVGRGSTCSRRGIRSPGKQTGSRGGTPDTRERSPAARRRREASRAEAGVEQAHGAGVHQAVVSPPGRCGRRGELMARFIASTGWDRGVGCQRRAVTAWLLSPGSHHTERGGLRGGSSIDSSVKAHPRRTPRIWISCFQIRDCSGTIRDNDQRMKSPWSCRLRAVSAALFGI